MSETGKGQLCLIPKEIDNLVKLAIMEASDVRPSFLCFLPELQCSPANIIYLNGITENAGIQHISGKAVSLSLAKKKSPQGTLDLTSRLSDASLETESCLSNGFAQSKASLAGNDCRMGVVEKGAQHALHEPGLESRESGNDQIAEHIGNHILVDESSGEVDILAFEITEFFNAFKEGQEHKLLKFTQTPGLLSPDSLLAPEDDQWGAKSNAALVDQHINSDKVVVPVDVDRLDGRISSSAGRSGNWNGLLEAESFSGPLTFSGPMSFAGNSGHVPYSGSVSHRSDSSTASTHSFAFPILPYEWNSSPVKMAQPDKRFLQRPWKRRLRSFFCCGDPFK